jgi:hypothetical protein
VFLKPEVCRRLLSDSGPCLGLMATVAFTIRDLRPIDNAHAGRTKTRPEQPNALAFLLSINILKPTA